MTDTAPIRLTWRDYPTILRKSFGQLGERNISLVSAGVAFFAMMSLFPALAAVIAVLSLIADPTFVVAQLQEMQDLVPDDVYRIIEGQIVTLVNASSDRLVWAGVISILLALWSARAGVGAMILGLNTSYSEQNRSTALHYLRAILLTIALISVGVVALLCLVVTPVVLAFVPLGTFGELVIDALRWLVTISVLFVGIGLLYRFGPNREETPVRWVSPGAVTAIVVWVGVSIGFSYYVANFGNYNQVYGSIGAVIAMLIWLWISSFVVLFGAVLNAEVERRRSDVATRSGTAS